MKKNPRILINKININQEYNKVVKRTMLTTTKNTLTKIVSSSPRSFSTHGGKFTPSAKIVQNPTTDSGQQIEGDTSGHHYNVVIKFCNQPHCETTNCADTAKQEPNPCGKTAQEHKLPIAPDPKFKHELAATLTHNVPKGKNGYTVDQSYDVNGPHSKGQSAVKESSKTTVKPAEFNENKKVTTYLQTNDHTSKIAANLPTDSEIFTK